ncbi:MAG: heparinase II/III family protein [Opitutaceae bacterium]|jgi:hypothetical protein
MPRLHCFLLWLIVVLAPPAIAQSVLVALPHPAPNHPRLLADAAKFTALRAQIVGDPVSARIFEDLRQRADALLVQPPLTYKKEGRRLLAVSREALARISILAMVNRLTDDPRYRDRAVVELRAVTAFKDWNPSHYLDTAEMTLAVAVGYDWLYDRLAPEDRAAFARAILELGLRQSEEGPASQHWWITGTNNWNQVCHAGMVAGAIALADEQPELARRIISRAVDNLHLSADGYAPDGAYPEGPMYWGYGTTFHVILADALEHFTGKTHGLDAFPGFLASADYMLQMVTPTGQLYDYSDCGVKTGLNSPQYWFARKTGRSGLLFGNNALLAASSPDKLLRTDPRVEAFTLLWRDPKLPANAGQPPLSWFGRGINPVATHRSAWSDARATFVGLKGGAASVSHGHMDAGSFLLEADGVRWAVDPGMQDYNSLESKGVKLWAREQDGERWKIFRLGPDSHNILRFDGAFPKVDGRGELVRFSAKPATSVANLDAVYAGQVKAVSRGVMITSDRCVLIQDEWTAATKAVEVTWQMLTQTDQVVVGEGEVRLTQAKESLTLRVLSPAGAKIAVVDVSSPQAPYDAPNPKLKRITITTRTAGGATGVFRILAVPGPVAAPASPDVRPLADWGDPVPLR